MKTYNLKEQMKKASIAYLNGKVKKIMDSKNFGEQWEVGDEDTGKLYVVSWITERGYNYFTCTCKNNTIHNLRNPECYHKQIVRMLVQNEVFR